jgi:hypothetical protein
MNSKVDFKRVRAAADKVEQSQGREAELAKEQEAIRSAIEQGTAAGLTDAKSLRAIQDDQTRLSIFPSKIAQQQAATADAIEELRNALREAGIALEHLAGELRTNTIEKLKADLDSLLVEDERWRIDSLISEIAPYVAAIRTAEGNASFCNHRDLSTVQVKTLLTRAENLFRMEQPES